MVKKIQFFFLIFLHLQAYPVASWDHTRRKFTDVVKACGQNKSGKAGQMLERIDKLYAIERGIKELPYDEHKAIRQAEAKPKLNVIHELQPQDLIDRSPYPPEELSAALPPIHQTQHWICIAKYLIQILKQRWRSKTSEWDLDPTYQGRSNLALRRGCSTNKTVAIKQYAGWTNTTHAAYTK